MNLGSIDLVILDEIGEAIKEKNKEFVKGKPSEMAAAIREIISGANKWCIPQVNLDIGKMEVTE